MQTESLLLELFSRGFGGVVSMVLHDDFDATMHLGPERIAVQSVDPSKETYGRGSMMHRLSFVSSMQPPDALTIAANPKRVEIVRHCVSDVSGGPGRRTLFATGASSSGFPRTQAFTVSGMWKSIIGMTYLLGSRRGPIGSPQLASLLLG